MDIVFQILDLIFLTAKLVLTIYSGLKFLGGDKEKSSTLWYGILFVATLV
nr:MAG TPA: hypothetical protein [Bacteriophage sp.]